MGLKRFIAIFALYRYPQSFLPGKQMQKALFEAVSKAYVSPVREVKIDDILQQTLTAHQTRDSEEKLEQPASPKSKSKLPPRRPSISVHTLSFEKRTAVSPEPTEDDEDSLSPRNWILKFGK